MEALNWNSREIKKQTKVEKKVTRWTVKNEAASAGDSAAQIAEGPEATYCWWVSEWAFTDQTSDLSDRSRSWRDVRPQPTGPRRLSSAMRTHTRYPYNTNFLLNTVRDRKLRCGASGRHSVLAILSDKWFAYTSLGEWFRFRTYMDVVSCVPNFYVTLSLELLQFLMMRIFTTQSWPVGWAGKPVKMWRNNLWASLELEPLRPFPFPASNEV